MKSRKRTPETDGARTGANSVESLLEAAGIRFTVVPRCPPANCTICDHHALTDAA